MTRLPPLNSLRVFECVARNGQLAAAAAELNITIGAVSHQLRVLQEQMGVDLFEKRGRRLVVTDRGALLQRRIGKALEGLSEGVREAVSQGLAEAMTLRLSLPPELTASWLSPRLFRFMDEHPWLRLHVESATTFEQLDWRQTDAAIIYGNPPWPGYWWRMLHGVRLMPVCSPQLLRGSRGIRHTGDIVQHRLLHEDDGSEWRRWLAQARVPWPGDSDVYFRDFGVLLQAARDGEGVALVDDIIAARDLDEGRLVQPVTLSVPAAKNYHLVCREEKLRDRGVSHFVDWLIAQVSPADTV